MSDQRGFRIGWVLVSYFMIAGGFVLAGSLMAALRIQNQYAGWIFCFAGGMLGGFIAARASEGKTILEPAIGGVLVIASIIGIIALVPKIRTFWALADKERLILVTGGIGLVTGAGGLVGATLGEKSSPPRRSEAGIRWMGVSALISTGVFFMSLMVVGIVMLRGVAEGEKLTDDQAGAFGVVISGTTAFFGGFVTQAIAPRRMNWACGSGFLVLMLAMMLVVISMPTGGEAAAGFIVLGGLGTPVGALGALVGWHAIAKKLLAEHDELPVARAFE